MISGRVGMLLFKRRFSQASKSTLDLKKSLLYQDDDYLVVDKAYGVSTFGRAPQKESIIKSLQGLNLEEPEDANVVYKLHNHVGGCLLICKNKFIKNHTYGNTFLALVYGKVEKAQNVEVKLGLKYLPNSTVMVPSNGQEHLRDLKTIRYNVVSNSIWYETHNFSLLKIDSTAKDARFIKPLLFYSLYTCIVGDTEYVGGWKKLRENGFFSYRDVGGQVERANRLLLKRVSKRVSPGGKNNELMLHLHCSGVTFQSACSRVVYVASPLPRHMRETLNLLGAPSLCQTIDTQVKAANECSRRVGKTLSSVSHERESDVRDDRLAQNGKRFEKGEGEDDPLLYDLMQDEGRIERENEELLSGIYRRGEIHRRGERSAGGQGRRGQPRPRRGALAKDVHRLTPSDAPIFFAEVQ
ncbi:conserved Plasmodium protein, unknown function [Plasmodium vivax]|uniref:Pseudouridine synthase, putative n=2 Tax=Plasmodium vivax TaxID=5855 RepID=A0A1G4GST1_PLAVI|nr:conserved Plasmodium protein, unknown function [Plasmodium vivax]SCO71071.1 conserved Plasmodium protein, unknown function [Plasmodium vivax]VUZ93781.1 pseudouridine synthase, putative [Plasmodium vivax]